ncbi:MAG: hypothetical protein K9J13_03815 [Saprospiraceae bacterium]|nr:hypothetical protein [Saprospiraceae bacterium]
MQEQSITGVEVKLEYYLFSWFYLLKPVIVLDEEIYSRKWGTYLFELEPGDHHIKIYFKYLFVPECGANSLDFKVEERTVTKIKYHMPMWVAMNGSIKEL